jgi:hypothetical protein
MCLVALTYPHHELTYDNLELKLKQHFSAIWHSRNDNVRLWSRVQACINYY